MICGCAAGPREQRSGTTVTEIMDTMDTRWTSWSEDIIQVACVSFFSGVVVGAIFGHAVATKSKMQINENSHCNIYVDSTGIKEDENETPGGGTRRKRAYSCA